MKYAVGGELVGCDRRSPYGERGLKSDDDVVPYEQNPSLSLRRAWIEMRMLLAAFRSAFVALLTESVD